MPKFIGSWGPFMIWRGMWQGFGREQWDGYTRWFIGPLVIDWHKL